MKLYECCGQIEQATHVMKMADRIAASASDLEGGIAVRVQAEQKARNVLPYIGNFKECGSIGKIDHRAAEIFLCFSLFQNWDEVKKRCGNDAEDYLKAYDRTAGEPPAHPGMHGGRTE